MADPQLLVALEARLDKFEKQLKQAGLIAEREIKEIEDRFSKMEITPGKIAGGVAAGQFIFEAMKKGLDAFIEKIKEAIDQMNRLNDVIERTGITSEQFQRMAFVGRTAGVDDKTIIRDVETLATKFDELNNRQTELGQLLDLNNIKYRDATGRVVEQNKQWEVAAELISRAVGPDQLSRVEKLLGISREWTNELRKGADALRATQARAPVQDLEQALRHMAALQQLARDLTAEFGNWGTPLITLVLPTLQAISQFLIGITATLAQITKGGVLENFAQNIADQMEKVAAAIERAVESANRTRIRVNKPAAGLDFPAQGKDAIDRQIDALEKHIAVMKAEAGAVGLAADAQEQFRVMALLTEAAIKSGVTATDELAEKFVQLSERAGAAKLRLEELKAAQAELNAASKEFGSALAEGLKEAILQGKKLDEVLKNLANRLASRAIDKIFDFFFSAQGGQGTSLFTSLLKGLTARQAGGPLSSGQAAIVGERGPELFIPKTAGKVIPNSALRSAGGVEVRIINNSGQPVAQQERQGPNGRVLEVTVGRLVRETINADLFQGGDIDRAMRSRFGLTPRLA